jgi:hypothetical protein
VLERQNLARCEGARSQFRAKRLGKRAKEKLDELGVWRVFRRPGRRNQRGRKLSVASWWIERRYALCASSLEVRGGQRPRRMMSSGRMTERRRIGCPQAGHRGTYLEVATGAGVSARPESRADGGSGEREPSCWRSQSFATGRGEESVVADFDKALGQNVLEEAADEFLSGEGGGCELAGFGGAVAEGHLAVGQFPFRLSCRAWIR